MDNAVCEDFLDFFFKLDYFDIEDNICFYQLNQDKTDILKDFKPFLIVSYKDYIKKKWFKNILSKFNLSF